MFVFERLITRNYEAVCYVIKCKDKDIFNFYTQNYEIMDNIYSADNSIDEMLDIYSQLWKTNREVLPLFYDNEGKKESMIEFKTPMLSRCFSFSYKEVMEQVKKRREEGKKSRVRISQ